jgi:ubiquinone/menaquinone biosynthesis C-methylase UbiE
MDARLQRRIQRYGWDRAAADYDALWDAPLAGARDAMTRAAALTPGQQVLDVACGTGSASLAASLRVGAGGRVFGVDLSGQMVEAAHQAAAAAGAANVEFARMDAENLSLPDAGFDAVLCAFGLMYLPWPERALREMRRVLRPGGRLALAVWGERARCGWSGCFEVVDREVASEVCPLFFRLGQGDRLAGACSEAGFGAVQTRRIGTTLDYASADEACDAVFMGGPVALAWSRFDAAVKARVRRHYIDTLSAWRDGPGYRVPAEFVVVSASVACRDPEPAGDAA